MAQLAQQNISRPMQVVLNGDNNSHQAQAIRNFLKGCKLWHYVTRQRKVPTCKEGEANDAYALHFEDWDYYLALQHLHSYNSHGIWGMRNTTDEVWFILDSQYSRSDGARDHNLMAALYQL